jgi:hypothetical protein
MCLIVFNYILLLSGKQRFRRRPGTDGRIALALLLNSVNSPPFNTFYLKGFVLAQYPSSYESQQFVNSFHTRSIKVYLTNKHNRRKMIWSRSPVCDVDGFSYLRFF